MMRRVVTKTTITAMALAAATAAPASAQMMTDDGHVAISVRGGPSIPGGDLADVTDPGGALGADVAWWFNDRVALSLDGNVDVLQGEDETIVNPDMNIWHYGAGLQLAAAPDESRWNVLLHGGAGATTMDTNDFVEVSSTGDLDFTETYFSLNGGVEVGYDVASNVDVAVRGSSFFVFTDEEETAVLTDELPGDLGFDSAVSFPITAEVHVELPN